MPSVAHRIGLLTDLFLGAAFADTRFEQSERDYVRALLLDLLCTETLPQELEARIEAFRPSAFNLTAAAQDFLQDPPMSKRRLLELVAYVTLSDGEQSLEDDLYVRALAECLGMQFEEYKDLTRDPEVVRESFTELARVPLPPLR